MRRLSETSPTRRQSLRLFGAAPLLAMTTNATGAIQTPPGHFLVRGEHWLVDDIIAPRPGEPFGAQTARIMKNIAGRGVLEGRSPQTDRWNRRRGEIVLATDAGEVFDVGQILVGAGAARVRPRSDRHEAIEALLRAEMLARQARRGLWRLEAYRVFDANSGFVPYRNFHLWEGVVTETAWRRSRAYLNFGEDYRTDATITMETRLAGALGFDERDFLELKGERVRARGYVNAINGPSISLQHRLQIQILPGEEMDG